MPESEHFKADELTCHHCGGGLDEINPRLLELLEQLRYNTGGLPLELCSVYRCEEWNAAVGGVPRSQHMLGNAADVACPDHLTVGELKWYCEQLPFDAIGYYPDQEFVHVDVRYGGNRDVENEDPVYWEG